VDRGSGGGDRAYHCAMHKRIGILGGMTPESTVTYYQHIVHRYQQRFGNHAYPEIVIYSVSFQQFEDWMEAGAWDAIALALADGLRRLHAAGAELAVIATNTMHLLFDRLERDSPVPLLSIVDATARAIERAGLNTVGLVGTRFTMEKPFYAERLAQRGIATIVPDAVDRQDVHRVIMKELSLGILSDASRRAYLEVIDRLVARGARGVVLGCTEIPLLVRQEHTSVPLFDTTTLHAEEALAWAIGEALPTTHL
jgi:aspartate racemase